MATGIGKGSTLIMGLLAWLLYIKQSMCDHGCFRATKISKSYGNFMRDIGKLLRKVLDDHVDIGAVWLPSNF